MGIDDIAKHDSDEVLDLKRRLGLKNREVSGLNKKLAATFDELEEAQVRLATFQETQGVNPKKLKKLRMKKGSATAFLLCSDWHAEESITRESSNGHNEFNLSIASKRISTLWSKGISLLEFSRNLADIRELVIWLGGDLINNQLHEEAAESNFLGPAPAIDWVQDRVAEGIDLLLKEANLDLITIVTSYGNHGRTTKKRRISTGADHSWEWLAHVNLDRVYRNNPKVQFSITKAYHNWLERHKRVIRFHHGDSIRFGGGVGGVTIPLRKKIAQWNKSRPADIDVLGHFHEFLDDWRYSINGCLCGYNAYAVEIGAEYQPPTQTLMVTSGQYPKLLNTPIYLP